MPPTLFWFLLILTPSVDFLALPFVRVTIGEILFIFLIFVKPISYLRFSRYFVYSLILLLLIFFHYILTSIIYSLPFTPTHFFRPFFYLLLSSLSLHHTNNLMRNKTLQPIFFFRKVFFYILAFAFFCSFLQFNHLFPSLPVYNPSFGFTSLFFRSWTASQPTFFSIEPSFVGVYLSLVLSIFLSLRPSFSFGFLGAFLSSASCFLLGTRAGFVISILTFIFYAFSKLLPYILSTRFKLSFKFLSLFFSLILSFFPVYLLFSSRIAIFIARLNNLFLASLRFFTDFNSSDLSIFYRFESVRLSLNRLADLPFFLGFGFNRSHPYIFESLLPYDSNFTILNSSNYHVSLTTWLQLPWDYGFIFFIVFPILVLLAFLHIPIIFIFTLFLCGFSVSMFNFFWFYFFLIFVFFFSYQYRLRNQFSSRRISLYF